MPRLSIFLDARTVQIVARLRAKNPSVNISRICSEALETEVSNLEKIALQFPELLSTTTTLKESQP